MKFKSTLILSIVVGFSLLVLGCPTVVTPPPDTTDKTADELADEAIALMKTQDWDGALSKFSEAVTKDPTNGRAVMGYAALNIASITSDSNVVAMAKNKLGFASYPSSMNQVLVPSNWMETLQSPYGGMFPTISGQAAYDGTGGPLDGTLDPNERMFAFAAWFATHNSGFSDLVTTVGTALGSRLDAAVTAIKSVGDSAQITLTWDMFSTTLPAEGSWWPYSASHQPMSIVIGKAELLALASSMEMVRGFTDLAQVYNLSLPLGEYWTAYNPIDGDGAINDPANKPFETFLQLNTGAAAHLASAKSSYTAAIDDFSTAADMVIANRAGYFVSSDASTGIFTDSTSWNNFKQGVRIAQKSANVTGTSIKNSTVAIYPLNMSGVTPETWPTTVISGQTVGVNYGLYFNSPIGLIGTIIELSTGTSPAGEAAGEPVYYSYSGGTTFPTVTSTYMNLYSNNFDGVGETLFVRVPDATFGGVLTTASFPVDDPNTQTSFSMNYNDTNVSGHWDPGETINYADYYADIEGLINDAGNSTYGGNPSVYYSTTGDVPDALLATYAAPADYAALRTQLSISSSFYRSSTPIYLQDGSIYMPIAPNWVAWNSFAAKGTSGTDAFGYSMTSAGSIWWALAKMLPWMTPPS